jgi:hypothetical protein
MRRALTFLSRVPVEFCKEKNPEDVNVLYHFGMAFSESSSFAQSEKHLRSAVDLARGFTNALVALGAALSRAGKNEERNWLFEWLRLCPNSVTSERVNVEGEGWLTGQDQLYSNRLDSFHPKPNLTGSIGFYSSARPKLYQFLR